jgi:hypothetical protein
VALVLDTSILYAALNSNDPAHDACATLLLEAAEPLVIPAPVLPQLDYWVRKIASADAWLSFCEDVAAGAYQVQNLTPALLVESASLQVRYRDLRLDLVDAAVFVVCCALGERKVATLDHRDFSVLRTSEGEALTILP